MLSPLTDPRFGLPIWEPVRSHEETQEPAPGRSRPAEATRFPVADEVQFSAEALRAQAADAASGPRDVEESERDASSTKGESELTPEEEKQVRELQARDREVRAHEQAHKAAAGSLAVGGPTYTYQTGPDGRRYAVGGEVKISIPEGRTPEETARIARQAQRAALAPAQPSEQDRKVAREASQKAAEAQREASEERSEKTESTGTEESSKTEVGSNPAGALDEIDEGVFSGEGAEASEPSTRFERSEGGEEEEAPVSSPLDFERQRAQKAYGGASGPEFGVEFFA